MGAQQGHRVGAGYVLVRLAGEGHEQIAGIVIAQADLEGGVAIRVLHIPPEALLVSVQVGDPVFLESTQALGYQRHLGQGVEMFGIIEERSGAVSVMVRGIRKNRWESYQLEGVAASGIRSASG
jgi:hypothetical protein